MTENFRDARVLVVPVQGDGVFGKSNAHNLVQLMNGRKLCRAEVHPELVVLRVGNSLNKEKILWNFALKFSNYVQENNFDADYYLTCDYGMNSDGVVIRSDYGINREANVRGVHLVLCDRNGNWVIVEQNNNHHRAFQDVMPQTPADCDKLVVERLLSYMN